MSPTCLRPASLPYALIVDDEPMVGQIVARLLSVAGYRIMLERDGPSALRALEGGNGRVPIAVIDIRLPGRNGFALAETIAIRFPETGVLFMAVNPDALVNRPSLALLLKPFTSAELIHAVERQRRAHRRRYMQTETYAARLCELIGGATRHGGLVERHVARV